MSDPREKDSNIIYSNMLGEPMFSIEEKDNEFTHCPEYEDYFRVDEMVGKAAIQVKHIPTEEFEPCPEYKEYLSKLEEEKPILCIDAGGNLCSGPRTLNQEYDPVNKPLHYNTHPSGVECITITEHMSFNLGNAIKYLWRSGSKNGKQDLEKSIWYVQREIERLYGE